VFWLEETGGGTGGGGGGDDDDDDDDGDGDGDDDDDDEIFRRWILLRSRCSRSPCRGGRISPDCLDIASLFMPTGSPSLDARGVRTDRKWLSCRCPCPRGVDEACPIVAVR
jgi:hypothetical protein